MCGIALIISGVRIELPPTLATSFHPTSEPEQDFQQVFSVNGIKAALRRRGPDSLGIKKIYVLDKEDVLCIVESEEEESGLKNCDSTNRLISSPVGDICVIENGVDQNRSVAELCFIGATLQLRGTKPIVQPLVDSHGNILVYNGEIFGGIYVNNDSNDAEVLMDSLRKCCSSSSHENMKACNGSGREQQSVSDILSTIRGPWALIYWQAYSKTLWFGRDALGRRSLLVHWPNPKDSRFSLSSVSPPSSIDNTSEECEISFWEELPCGVYSLQVSAPKLDASMDGQVKKHDWADHRLHELISWERALIQPQPEELNKSLLKIPSKQHDLHLAHPIEKPYKLEQIQASLQIPSQAVLHVLREAVMRRSAANTTFKTPKLDNMQDWRAPVAVLFSGGLDSMILAALLNDCLDPKYEIDLLNVSFDSTSAPDRVSARAGLKELKRISSVRRWNLVEIDAELSKLALEMKHVMSLITPAKTYMDLNIGVALWLAAAGDGWVYEAKNPTDGAENGYENYQRSKFKSDSRILLVGSGADEQCAGYGRHRTKYRNAGWLGLHEEMKLDMQRIWKRNLGRDDRCIADNGKEARFPFLDEDVIRTLLEFPLWEIADLNQPSGKGDKKILREVAQLLGLHEASILPKRAIQFGSRIARESNLKNFGSNRAANQASAGSVDFFKQSRQT